MITGMTITEREISQAQQFVASRYKDEEGKPFQMTHGQAQIFIAIAKKKVPRIHIETHTRYGKSEVISMAILTRITTKPEKWAIVAGNTDKAGIIMADIIKHVFDNEYTRAKYIIPKGENEENIRRYRNKDKLNFDLGEGLLGEVYITNAAGAMGFGAPNVVEDESALVSTEEHSLVMRMLADQPVNFLAKVGNPWPEEHFIKSFEDPNYAKIFIDYHQGIAEGRLDADYIEEVRKEANFDVLWECKFPPSGLADESGWVQLISREQVKKALVSPGHPGFGVDKLGGDVAGGGRNFSVIVERRENVARVKYRQDETDTMTFVEKFLGMYWDPIKRRDIISRRNVAVDKVGIGRGVYDMLNRQTPGIIGVNAGDKLDQKVTRDKNDLLYFNLRAKMFWKLSQWLIKGGRLEMMEGENENDSIWYELCRIKYMTKLEGTIGKIRIMPKEQMLKLKMESPDCFIAETKILTLQGNKNIEELKEGDKIITPFGNRTIIKKWEVKTDKLTKVIFSNGSSLIGKPKHKILTKRGFISLDALLLTDIIEVRNNLSTLLWKIKNVLFIKEKSIGLRKQADIFMPIFTMVADTKQGKKNHCITEFGKNIIKEKYQKDIVSTIKTTTLSIIIQETWNWFKYPSIHETIYWNDLLIKSMYNQIADNSILSARLPLYGINQKQEENGTKNIQRSNGKIQKQSKENVLSAENNSQDILKQKDFAVYPVHKKQRLGINIIIQIKEFVYFVKKNLWQIGIGLQNVAVDYVQTDFVSSTKVYNLTLDKDNVYYANGILVENCADAMSFTFAGPDIIEETQDDWEERQGQERSTQKVDPFNPFSMEQY